MKLRRVISTLLIAAIMVSVLPSVSVRANAVETAPEMQMQEDFIYTETIQNQDETQKRMRANIDLNWRFQLGDPEGAEQTEYDDSDWRLLNLPHDWTIEGEYSADNPSGGSCGYLPGGIGWYRKTLTVPQDWKMDRKLYLEFDGVFRNSEVYINGQLVGERPYGWISFAYDISPYFAETDTVEIAVRVDNSLEPAARWYTGSGIYGHVYLLSTPKVHVDRYGTYVTTPEVSAEMAKVSVETTVKNDTTEEKTVSVRSTIYDPQNQQVAQLTSEQAPCAAGEEGAVVKQELTVSDPTLWDTENPALYRLYTEVLVDGETVDDYETTFGIRTISFSNTDGFFLNGENMKLQGVADHWAAGALGAAVPENIVRYRLQMLKDMGVNAVRTSHNPRPSYFYDICDELGILVMDEVFDGWKKKATHDYGAHDFAEWWETDVTEWVLRDRNHPSIIIWSIGNETGANDINGIVDLIEQYDTTRGTTGGGVSQGVSIVGVNGPSEKPGYQQPNKELPFVSTEAPHTWQVRGMYETQTWYRDGYNSNVLLMENLTEEEIFQYDWVANPSRKRGFQSSYDNAYVRASARYNWTATRDNDWRMGEFRWTGFDYLGEASYVSGGYPYRLFTSGAIDCANFEKDLYYLYQSMWTDDPMVHILPSWTHPIMEEGTEIPVWVYSNCEVVELFKDGISLGKITRGPMDEREWDEIQYEWLVPWSKGTLVAVGYAADGTTELTREEITTAGAPAKISLASTTDGDLPVDHTFVEQITVTTTDAEGNFYPYGENRAYYHVDGPAYIRAVDNGSPVDVEQHYSINNRNAFMGLNKVYLQPTQDEGDILFTAASILGEKRQLTSNLVSIDVEQLVLRGTPNVPEINIYYTIDGTEPTKSSTLYTMPFEVELETTVRAAVYANGEKILDMQETFGANEGLYWDISDDGVSTVPASRDYVYPAENAQLAGNYIGTSTTGSGYYDGSYVDFGNAPGTITFTIDDCEAGEYYLGVRYNNGAPEKTKPKKLELTVNDVSQGEYQYKNTGEWNNSWAYATHKVTLQEGKNTITFVSTKAGNNGVNMDEIVLWPSNCWTTPGNSEVTNGGTAKIKNNGVGALGAEYVDFGNNGFVEFTVTAAEAGEYPLYLYYASGKPVDRICNLDIYVKNEKQTAMEIQTTNAYNNIWTIGAALVTLEAGENTLKLQAPTGGIVLSGIMLGEKQLPEITGESKIINASCAAYNRLGTTEENPACVSTDVLEGVVWTVADTDDGASYLVHEETGKFLSYDGSSLLLDAAPGENAKWNINGDQEFYDYIQHVVTGKKLGVDENGLIMLPGDYGVDDDFTTNMAYWALVSPADSSEKTPAEIAAAITEITQPKQGDSALTLPVVDENYSVRIFSTSHPDLLGLDGSITWPTEDTEVEVVLVIQRKSDRTTAKTGSFTVLLEKQAGTVVHVTDVKLDQTKVTLTEGGELTLVATVAPADATNKAVTWKSSNTAVATVEDGVVKAIAPGTATITVTTVDGGCEDTCAVTVKAEDPGHTHTLTHVEAKDATCTEPGYVEYWHCECDMNFADAEGKEELTTVTTPIDRDNHVHTKVEGYEAATILTPGYTGDLVCQDCRTVVKKGEVIPRKGSGIIIPTDPGTPSYELPFVDVPEGEWYYESVYYAWDADLIDGTSATTFRPDHTLTVAQAIKLAAALHQLENDGRVTLANGKTNWYDTYVAYAVKEGIIESKYQSYAQAQMNAPAKRNEFVHILHGALDDYAAINAIGDNAIPDVKTGDTYAAEIYDFYRAGILTGSNAKGTFHPESSIKRSEVAAILVRMYDESMRLEKTL